MQLDEVPSEWRWTQQLISYPQYRMVASQACGLGARRALKLRWSDGTHFFVQLVEADEVDEDLGGQRLSGPLRFARVGAARDVFFR